MHHSIVLKTTARHSLPPRPSRAVSGIFLLLQSNNIILMRKVYIAIIWNTLYKTDLKPVRPDVLTRVSNGCITFVQPPLSLMVLEYKD